MYKTDSLALPLSLPLTPVKLCNASAKTNKLTKFPG